MFKTVIFFLSPTAGIRRVAPHVYAQLAKGEADDLRYAGQTVRVADWYVKLSDGRRGEILNETYSLLSFDPSGHVLQPLSDEGAAIAYCPQGGEMETFKEQENLRSSNVEHLWLPTREERTRMLATLDATPDEDAGP